MSLVLLLLGMWLFTMLVGSLKGPYFPNMRTFRGNHVPANLYNRWIGATPSYKHGQELTLKTLRDIRDNTQGRTVYWDSYRGDYVDKKEDLS